MINTTPHPPIVSREQWLAARKRLLEHEKEHTKQYDLVNAERRRLPMVKIDRDYVFDGPNGKQHLKDLFDGRRQLIVYHFMFDPTWDKGCSVGIPTKSIIVSEFMSITRSEVMPIRIGAKRR